MIKGKKYCLFIEKKDNTNIKIYSLKFRFDSILYNGTIFEGILTLNNKHCWIYFITDIYCMSGNIINNLPFSKRLNLISEILKTKYKYDDFMNVCHIQIQSFFLYHHLEMIKKNSNKELVFHPEYDSIKYIHHIKKMKSKYNQGPQGETIETRTSENRSKLIPKSSKFSLCPLLFTQPTIDPGLPITRAKSGTSLVITAPEPTNAYCPIVTPQTIVAFAPIETLLPTFVGL